MHIYNAVQKSFLTLNTPAYQSVLLSKRTPEEEDSIQDYQDYLDSMSESGLFTLVADKTVRLETDEIVYPEKYEYTGLTFELPDHTVQIEHFVTADDVVTLDYQVIMHDVPYTETDDDRYERSLFYLLDQDGRFIATAMDGGTIFTANCDVIPYETEDGMLAFDCWMSYALDPAREISTFIFAPNRETKSFAGEQAERFEALYRITVPQECFAITLANGELFTPAQDYTQSDGDLEFRLTNTDISLYGLEIEWTVENKGDEPIYYYIESSFVPLEGGDPNWFFMSDGGSADYCNSTMFGANGVVLSAEHPSYDGDCRRFCESTIPFPGGTFTLTLHAFRAVGEPEWDENENNETFSFTDGLHTKALVSKEYLGLLPENIDFDDVQPYREALTGSGLFEQIAVLEHTLELPAFSEVSQVSFSDIAFDFDGRHFHFNLIDISASGVDIQYTVDEATEYTDEAYLDGLYFGVTAYQTDYFFGYRRQMNGQIQGPYDSLREDLPAYFVLVPYEDGLSSKDYEDLHQQYMDGGVEEAFAKRYSEADPSRCIRIYANGTITTNEVDPEDATVLYIPGYSTLSKPLALSAAGSATPSQHQPASVTFSDGDAVYETADRYIVLRSYTVYEDEPYRMDIEYTVHTMQPFTGDTGASGDCDYYVVDSNGKLLSTLYLSGMENYADEYGNRTNSHIVVLEFAQDEPLPEYVIFAPSYTVLNQLSDDERVEQTELLYSRTDPQYCFEVYLSDVLALKQR